MHWNQLLYLDPLNNTSYHYSKDPHPLCSVCMTEKDRERIREVVGKHIKHENINRKREIVLDRIVNSQRKLRSRFSLTQKERSSCKRERKNREGWIQSDFVFTVVLESFVSLNPYSHTRQVEVCL